MTRLNLACLTIFIILFVSCNNSKQSFNEDKDMYDGPDLAAEFEFNRTKDPATGKVPRERLFSAIEQTIESKNINPNSPNGIAALSWIERGPNSDVVGSSNGNTRANSGIASGRIRAIMVDSNDVTHKTVFIGGVDGGLWKTTDITTAPANWTLVNDYLSNLAVSAICQDPRPGFTNIMYFCTGESYFNFEAVQGNGVFKSTDGGATWTYLASTSSFVNGTRILCDYLGNVYLATRGSGLQRSTNGGTSWTNITPAGLVADICDLEISSTSVTGRLHIVSGIFSTQAYRFCNTPETVTSATWIAPTTAFPSFAMRAEIACSGNTLYALPANASRQVPTIYKSTDGGVTWATTGGVPSATWASGQGWYALAVDINPANANECIIGGLDTWKTINGGTSWSQLSTWVGTTPVNQYVHADVHKVLWYDGGNKLIFGCDGGIHYSADKGVTIRDRNQGLRIKQFYSCAIHPSTTNYFLAGAQDNGVHQFNNAGLSSTVEVTGGDGGFVAIDQNEPQYQFGSYVFNDYRRSTNGGASWSSVTLSGTGQFINPFDYDNTSNIMYCGDAASSYLRWTNPQTGSTAAAVAISNLTGNVTAVSVSPYTTNKVYFGTDAGKIVQVNAANTIVSGSAGTDRSTGLPAGTVSCINQGTDDNNLIAVFSNYGINNIWVSSNGGTTWAACDGNLPDMPVRWAMFYPGNNSKAFIATETGIWETTLVNGASTVWAANNTFPTVRTDMIKYRPLDGTIAAATHGRGLWTATIPLTTTPDIQFQLGADAQTETTVSTTACRGYKDYTYNMTIANPPTGTGVATVTLGIAGGGTATQNIDYALLTPTLSFATGVITPQPFTIRIYDDAAVESAETFTINYTLAVGSTNAQAGASNQTLLVTINDNDVAPVAGFTGTQNIGVITYDLIQTTEDPLFNSRLASKKTQMLFKASELSAAGITPGSITGMAFYIGVKASTRSFLNLTIKMVGTTQAQLVNGSFTAITGLTTVKNPFTYATIAGYNNFTFDVPYIWNGTDNLAVEVCYDNGTADVTQTSDHTYGYTDGSGAAIGNFVWQDGINCAAAFGSVNYFNSGVKPVIKLTENATGTTISTALNSSKTAYLGPNDDVYFYDGSNNIIARIKNLTAFDYGCTQVIIDRAGTNAVQFWNNNLSNYLAAKSFKVIPTNNTTTGSYQITLYYTNGEVSGFNTAVAPNTFAVSKIVKVSNGFYVPDVTTATPHISDVTIAATTTTVFGTSGNIITSTFGNTGFSGFGIGIPCNPLSGVILWTGAVNNIWSNAGNWACGVVPGPTSDVQINGGLINYPFVNSNVTVKSLTIKPSASVTVATGFTLTTN
jgi:trimeric autotransporter adhesin